MKEFNECHGNVLFMMALETCHASVAFDIEGVSPVNDSTKKFSTYFDNVSDMEHKYLLTDPKAIIFNSEYKELELLGLVAVLLEWHSNLLADRIRTALTALKNMASSWWRYLSRSWTSCKQVSSNKLQWKHVIRPNCEIWKS